MGIILHAEYFELAEVLTAEEKAALWDLLGDFTRGRQDGLSDKISRNTAGVQIIYKVISERASREIEKREAIIAKNRENGKKGGRPKKTEEEAAESDTKADRTQKNPTVIFENPKNHIPIPNPIPIPNGIEKKREKEKAPNGTARFIRPTVEEVDAYCRERGNSISAQGFINYYDSVGWKVGKNPMKDWRAAVRTWEARDKKTVEKPKPQNRFHDFDSRNIDYDAILKAEG